jgi:flagellar hook-associated protein 2
VEVGYDGGVLTATSSRWGRESTLALTGGSALAPLFGTPVATDGRDIAGTLGGRPATGAGQRLTGSGLAVDVSGTASGARGEVRYALGFAARIDAFVDRMVAGDGALAARTGGIQRSIDGLDRDRGNVLRRLDAIETRLRAQFVALDSTLASMTATSSYLQQQLAALPKLQAE